MKRNPGRPRVRLDSQRESLVTHSGALLVEQTMRITGLEDLMVRALEPWRPHEPHHEPGKIVLDLAVTLAMGGDCVSDTAALRAQPGLFGPVASPATISRLIGRMISTRAQADAAVAAIRAARARARDRSWARRRPLAGTAGRRDGGQVIVDIDATVVASYSDKQGAEGSFKRIYGFHPICAFVDHGPTGTGEVLALNLRPGNASARNAADHITVLDDALAQLPLAERAQVLVRTDAGGCSKTFLAHITDLGLEYSVGFVAHDGVQAAIATIPERAWVDALHTDRDGGGPREDVQVADLTDHIPATTRARGARADHEPWPPGMRVIARRERPLPGTQYRITDHHGWRITCFATNTPATTTATGTPTRWSLPDLEVRHRERARAEDRIRCAKDTGLRALPYHLFDQNRIWLEIVALANDLIAWTQTLSFHENDPARRYEPKTFRFRILAVAGRLIHTARQTRLRLARDWPWNHHIDTAWATLTAPP